MIKHIKKEPIYINNNKISIFLLLHGYGADENDLFSIFNKIPENFLVISLQGLYPMHNGGFSWYEISLLSSNEIYINEKQAIKSSEEIIIFIKDIIYKYYKGKKTDIWICGFSQGAILSYYIALKYPYLINKVIILSGFPYNKILPTITFNNILYINKLKFFITHGKYDNIISINLARNSLKLINNLKINNFFYKEYESGHTISQLNFQDLINWIYINNKIK